LTESYKEKCEDSFEFIIIRLDKKIEKNKLR